jgi:hypothetical protein
MGTETERDFGSLLDELIAESVAEVEPAARPNIAFDYLSVADELHSGRIKVSAEAAAAEYKLTAGEEASQVLFAAIGEALVEELPAISPEAISRELGLPNARPAELSRKRRSFAFKNHPDRVAPHLRQRAMIRMQVANMLIDEAERKAGLNRR